MTYAPSGSNRNRKEGGRERKRVRGAETLWSRNFPPLNKLKMNYHVDFIPTLDPLQYHRNPTHSFI
jgi:hypothetical protein